MTRWLKSDNDQRARAALRDAACRAAREGMSAGGGVSDAHIYNVALVYQVTPGTIRRWLAERPNIEDCLDAPRSGRPGRIWDRFGAEQAFGFWMTDYLRPEKPTAIECLRRILRIGVVRKWDAPKNVKAYLRRLQNDLSLAERVRAREGALPAMDLLPAQQRSVAGMRPLDIINGDGKRHDVAVILPSGRVGRPSVWYWQDVRTRRLLAWHATENENAEAVRLSLHQVIVEHGVPKRVLVDSTRAAANKWMTGQQKSRRRWRSSSEELPGILTTLGIAYSSTMVDRDAAGRGKGRGRAKPIERAFADMAHYIDTHPLAAGAYTGRSPTDRPETHRQRPIDWATFERLVAEGVAEYNARVGRRTEAAAGRSFDECWRDEIAQTTVRRLSAAQASMLLLAVESSKIKRDGTFTLKAGRGAGLPANRYTHICLTARAGENLVVRFDPAVLHDDVHVFDPSGRYVCAARCLLPVGFADKAAADEYEKQRRGFRKSAETGLAARRRMDDLIEALDCEPLPVPAKPKPAAIRLVTNAPEAPCLDKTIGADRRAQLLRGLRRTGE